LPILLNVKNGDEAFQWVFFVKRLYPIEEKSEAPWCLLRKENNDLLFSNQ